MTEPSEAVKHAAWVWAEAQVAYDAALRVLDDHLSGCRDCEAEARRPSWLKRLLAKLGLVRLPGPCASAVEPDLAVWHAIDRAEDAEDAYLVATGRLPAPEQEQGAHDVVSV